MAAWLRGSARAWQRSRSPTRRPGIADHPCGRPAPSAAPHPPPLTSRARRGLLIAAAAVSGLVIPWELGFGDLAAIYDPSVFTPVSWLDGLLVMLFCADIGARTVIALTHAQALP